VSANVSDKNYHSYPVSDMVFSSHALIDASSLLTLIGDEYRFTGRISVGALQHVTNTIDSVVNRLSLDTLEQDQAELPF